MILKYFFFQAVNERPVTFFFSSIRNSILYYRKNARCLSPLLIPPRSPSCYDAPPSSPLGALRPDLYTRREGPLFLGDAEHSLGRLHLRLKYDFDRSDFNLTTWRAAIREDSMIHTSASHFTQKWTRENVRQPFIVTTQTHFSTRISSFPSLQSKELVLQVFDYDRFSRNDVVGEVRIRIEELDLSSSLEVWGEITRNKKLEPSKQVSRVHSPPEEMQEVLLSLSYLPSAERLTVVLLKARNLFLPSDKFSIGTSFSHYDKYCLIAYRCGYCKTNSLHVKCITNYPYVKVYLLIDGKRMKKKKTAARKENCNPVWNEALSFNVAASNLSSAAIEICVLDQANDLMSSGPLLGCCVVGAHEQAGPERDHWVEMSQTPRKAVAMWHTLR
ncbi:hypothetical protein B566_EDAN002805 [Ephemera danica]|nr:hypothetical protein B566_EDAN002805 [Ephemera danica]